MSNYIVKGRKIENEAYKLISSQQYRTMDPNSLPKPPMRYYNPGQSCINPAPASLPLITDFFIFTLFN